MPKRSLTLIVALALVLGTVSGCARLRNFSLKPYRINIQQGNFLDQEDVDMVEAGMTRSQVRFLLGTPMVEDLFNTDLKIGRSGQVFRRHFVVYFEGDSAVRVEKRGDNVPIVEG
jgi:outer membrane protein assembly factor BamE